MSDLVGLLKSHNETYIVGLRDGKTSQTWFLYSNHHIEDKRRQMQGIPGQHPELTLDNFRRVGKDNGYLLEVITRIKSTGKITFYKSNFILSSMIKELAKIQVYSFPEDTVQHDQYDDSLGIPTHAFAASHDDYTFIFYKEDGVYRDLSFVTPMVQVSLSEKISVPTNMNSIKKEFVELKKEKRVEMVNSLIKSVDYRTLRSIVNLDWYESNGKKHKNYIKISNKKDFEELVINDMINEMIRCRLTGEEFLLAFDTETTGLVFINISKDNPLLDSLVCISMSWKDDFAALIFLDMEYFDNIEMDYALERLKPFLEKDPDRDEIEYVKKTPKLEVVSDQLTSHSFANSQVTDVESYEDWEYEVTSFRRSEITIVTHNGMFDGKVMYHYGIEVWFDMDTLQLAFNMNPKLMKGNNKLEALLLREMGIEVPSLAQILGKGNEGAYRLIDDLEVALIYAGSDTDNLRPLFKRLRKLIGKKLYDRTVSQDIYHMNWLYVSEYYGMRTDAQNFETEGMKVKARLEFLEDWMKRYVGKIVQDKNAKQLAYIYKEQGDKTEEEVIAYYKELVSKPSKPYNFEVSGESLRQTLFNVLTYPIVKRNKSNKRYPEGQPAVDKFAIEKLQKEKVEYREIVADHLALPEDRDPETMKFPKDAILVDKDDLNTAMYPLAFVLSTYGKLKKEYESYFAPILENNYEGIISRGYSLSRIETRRIMNALQTLKARLKKWILPTSPDHYMIVWDQAQVEPRIMVSLSGDEGEIQKFKDPEKDYHTETASRIQGIAPHTLAKKIRKIYKEITLGLPYGLGLFKMCERIHGVITTITKYETQVAIDAWQTVNKAVFEMLLKFRSDALTPLKEDELPEELYNFITKPEERGTAKYGATSNLLGFRRLFRVDGLDSKGEGKVMRPAGNFPIQSFAAEMFRMILRDLREALRKQGIIKDVIFNMLVHDECVMSVHKSVHPFLMLKLIYENCNRRIKGHTTYFVGINVGDNWADGKDDEAECPVIFVDRIRKRWDAGEFREDDYWNWRYEFLDAYGKPKVYTGPKGYVYQYKQEYTIQRVGEEVERLYPKAKTGHIVLNELLEVFDNYMVRAYVSDFFPPNHKVNFKDEAASYSARFESWILDYYGEGITFTDYEGNTKVVTRVGLESQEEKVPALVGKIADEDELDLGQDNVSDKEAYLEERDSFFSFDSIEFVDYSDQNYDDTNLTEDEWWDKYIEEEEDIFGNKVAKMKSTNKYKYIQKVSNSVMVDLVGLQDKNRIKVFLKPHLTTEKEGIMVVFRGKSLDRWKRIKPNFDLDLLEEEVKNVVESSAVR